MIPDFVIAFLIGLIAFSCNHIHIVEDDMIYGYVLYLYALIRQTHIHLLGFFYITQDRFGVTFQAWLLPVGKIE